MTRRPFAVLPEQPLEDEQAYSEQQASESNNRSTLTPQQYAVEPLLPQALFVADWAAAVFAFHQFTC